jgi:prevent-host-death family protein
MTIMYQPKRKKSSTVRESGAPIPATAFKAHCLEWMDYVHDTGREVVVTKHGKPVAKLVPVGPPRRSVEETIEAIRENRKGSRLGGLKIKDLINEGRR